MTDGTGIACRVCASSSSSRLSAGGCSYSRCRQCGTLQKLLTHEQYLALEPGYDPGLYLSGLSEPEIRAYLNVDDMRELLADVLRRHDIDPQGKSYLDIGCGMGGYMLAARDLGLVVQGFEPSANHGRVATKVLKLPVDADYFSSEKVGKNRYDVILLSHVIEHIYEPAPFIADLLKVLKPRGLVVMVTPNSDALTARLSGAGWPMLVPLDHVTLLTPRAVPYLTPPGYRADVRTTEYPFEFLMTLGSMAKRALKGRAVNHADIAPLQAPKLSTEVSMRTKLLRKLFTVGSAPAYWLAGLTNRRSALVFTLRKA